MSAIATAGARASTDLRRYDAGLPAGTARLALHLAQQAADNARRLTGHAHHVDVASVMAHLWLPVVTGDQPVRPSCRTSEPDPVHAPRAVDGGGYVHTDLVDHDEALFASLLGTIPLAAADEVAAAAQQWRLPVTAYRSADDVRPAHPAAAARTALGATPCSPAVEPRHITVIDLTSMWAGPLCTMMLAAWGARVVTVEPRCRPDGMRRSPGQFAALDRGKERLALDLRLAADRHQFEQLVARADVVIESFSRRVMPNFGYGDAELRALNPRVAVVAIRAFRAGTAEAEWLAYGRGVHAASGLGMVDGTPRTTSVAYPDPLTGIAAFNAVLHQLATIDRSPVEVSLAGTIAPLLDHPALDRDRPDLAPGSTIDHATVAELRDVVGRRPASPVHTDGRPR